MAFIKLKYRSLVPVVAGLLFIACGGGNKDDGDSGKDTFTQEAKEDSAQKKEKGGRKKTFHRVPTPGHMLTVFERYDQEPSEKLLLDPDKGKDLVNSDQQALHLGIYSTDLAYTSVYGMGSKALSYFKRVRELGDKLEISSAFDEETIKKIEKNVGKSDSLKDISKDTYIEAFEYLEKNDRGKTLALLVAGGWTEALYLSVNMIDEYRADDPMVQYIADQKVSFKNLRKFMKEHKENESVAKLLERMQGLKEAFAQIQEEGGSSKMEEKEGKKVLSGGGSRKIDQNTLELIRKEANSLREDLVKGKLNSSS